jgi:sugar phosphate isomerase/epimerase
MSAAHYVFGSLLLAAALGLSVATRAPGAADDDQKKVNVGLQLYSLREQFPKDVPGTLAEIEKWGITDVESAGTYNLTAEQFRAELDKHHLKASGMHVQWNALLSGMDQVIADAKALGVEYVTLPWIPHKGASLSEAEAKTAIERFNEWGEKLAKSGLKFTYHPHGYEFKPLADGSTLFDALVAGTKPEFVNFELDVFWAYHGGADPAKLMQKYPTRIVQLHLKDMARSVQVPKYTGQEDKEADMTLGQGQIDIKGILEQATKIGVKHYYIEDESRRSEQQIPQSVQYVRSLGF